MTNIKYALEMFIRKPFFLFITIIQLTAVIIFLNITIITIVAANDTAETIYSIFGENNFYSIQDRTNEEMLFEYTFKQPDVESKMNEFYNFLKDNEEFTFIEVIDSSILIQGEAMETEFYFSAEVPTRYIGTTFNQLKRLDIGNAFFEFLPYQTINGNLFSEEDYQSGFVNKAILGYEYQRYYDVGDTIEIYDELNEETFKVQIIDFLERDAYFLNRSGLINLDYYITLPMQPVNKVSDNSISIFDHRINQSFIIADDIDSVFHSIESASNRLDLYSSLEPYDLNEHGDVLVQTFRGMMQNVFPIGIAILLFSTISIITALLSIIKKSKKEFGIHLLSGGTLNDIALRIITISIFYIGISFVLGIILTNLIKGTMFPEFATSQNYYFYTIPILFLLLIIITITPVTQILRSRISDIISRKE